MHEMPRNWRTDQNSFYEAGSAVNSEQLSEIQFDIDDLEGMLGKPAQYVNDKDGLQNEESYLF
jgi:hypothetical protein